MLREGGIKTPLEEQGDPGMSNLDCGKSVFEVLLQRNPGAAEEILNDGVLTNSQVRLYINVAIHVYKLV